MKGSDKTNNSSPRDERLAAALRANLRRRKAAGKRVGQKPGDVAKGDSDAPGAPPAKDDRT